MHTALCILGAVAFLSAGHQHAANTPSPIVELKPWMINPLTHPTLGHRVSLDMWRLSVSVPGGGIASQLYDVRGFPNRQWIALKVEGGKRVPLDVYRDNYTASGPHNVQGRLLVRWLDEERADQNTPEAFSPTVELRPWTTVELEHPTSGHRLSLDAYRLSVRSPTSNSKFFDLRKVPNREWRVLELEGHRLPIAIFLDNYAVHLVANSSGRVLVHWLATAPSGNVTGLVAATKAPPSALLKQWIRDTMGSPYNYRRSYQFNANGTYEFLYTSRPAGSMAQEILVREVGRFAVDLNRLVISPNAGSATSVRFNLDRDPYGSRSRLVMFPPGGTTEIFYER